MFWIIYEAVIFIVALFSAIIFHELGHAYYITERLKRKVEFNKSFKNFGVVFDDSGVTDKQYKNIYVFGILAGFIPIFLLSMSLNWLYFYGAMIFYLFGCKSDLKQIGGILRK